MKIIRRTFYGLLVGLLSAATFAGIYLTTLSVKLTNRDSVKRWPVAAGTYEQVSASIIKLVETRSGVQAQTIDQALSSGIISKEEFVRALEEILPPSYWQGKTEQFLDSVYDYLEGKAETLNFEISFSDRTVAAADKLSKIIAGSLSAAPECDASQTPQTIDPLTLTCLPPGADPGKLADDFKRQLTIQSQIGNITLTDEDLLESGGPLTRDSIASLPLYYSYFKNVGIYFAGAVFILGLLMALAARSALDGLRKVSQTLFSSGILAWISFFIGKTFISRGVTVNGSGPEQDFAQDTLLPLIEQIVGDISAAGMWVSVTVVVIGAMTWLAAYSWHKIHHHGEAERIAKNAMRAHDELPKPSGR